MTHKLRTLKGQLRSTIQRNATLAAERDEARRHANQLLTNHNAAVSRADAVAHLHTHPRMETELKVPSGHVIIDKHFFDALQRLITQDIARQAGWKL